MLAFGATVPGLHSVCCVLPVGAKKPRSVGVHSAALVRLVAAEYEPSLHGSGALAASGQNEPASHGLHSSLPGSSWYVPAAHLLHALMLAFGATVPGLHVAGSAAPVPHDEPGGHGTQSSALVIERFSRSIVAFW